MTPTRYNFGSHGNSKFLRAVADALDETFSSYFENETWQEDALLLRQVPQLHQTESVHNCALIDVAGTFTLFIATCFSKKLFDDVYERTLKRPIGSLLDKLLGIGSALEGKTIELRDAIYLEDIDLVVLIRAKISSESAKAVVPLFLKAHKVAHAYIETNGRKAPVHCHTIVMV
jgi:hypothetical protein